MNGKAPKDLLSAIKREIPLRLLLWQNLRSTSVPLAPMKICHSCQQTYSDTIDFCPRDGARLAAPATETEAQLAAGLSRRFRLVRRLGKGGMGTVFLAEQIGVGNRPVALKVLNRKLLDDPDFLLRFQNRGGFHGTHSSRERRHHLRICPGG